MVFSFTISWNFRIFVYGIRLLLLIKGSIMRITTKTKAQLLIENDKLKAKIAELEKDEYKRNRVEARLQESEELYRLLHENAGLGIAYFTPDGIVLSYNTIASRNLNGSPEDFMGKSLKELYPEDQAELYFSRLQTALKSRENKVYEDHLKLPEKEMWFLSTYTKIVDSKDKVLGIQIISQDITDLKIAEHKLEDSEQYFYKLFELAPFSCSITDMNGDYVLVNEHFCNKLNMTKEDIIGKNNDEIIRNSGNTEYFRDELIKHGVIKPTEITYENNGKIYHSLFSSRLIKWKNEEMILSATVDTSRIKEAEQASFRSNERYKTLFDESPVPLWEEDFTPLISYLESIKEKGVSDLNSYFEENSQELVHCARIIKVVDVNMASLTLHEVDSKGGLINNLSSTFTDKSFEVFKSEVVALAEGKILFEAESEVKTMTGELRNVFLKLKIDSSIPGQYRGLLATTDITKRKRAEEDLKQHSRELSTLNFLANQVSSTLSLEQVANAALEGVFNALAPDLALIFLREGNDLILQSLKANAHLEEYFLDTRHKVGDCLCGLAVSLGSPAYSLDISKDLRCTQEECKLAGIHSYASLPMRSGDEILGIVAIGAIIERDFEKQSNFLEILVSEVAVGIQNALLFEQVSEYSTNLEQLVTERTAELKATNKELEAFAYSVSHDLRAPLRAINGFTQILLRDYDDKLDSEGKRLGDIIKKSSTKMGRLIDDLLTFSRLGKASIYSEEIDMNHMIKDVFEEVASNQDKERIEFICENLLNVKADPMMFKQIWVNLISNAIKFSSKKERAVIIISSREENSKTIFSIEDNGAGFNDKYRNKLFGVFQRLHNESEFPGTGVGLAFIKRILDRHNGEVWAKGVEGKGATFYISIPDTIE